MQTQITPAELKQLITEGRCHLVDVREPVEHAEEHISAARLIPLGELEKRASELPKDKSLVIHCKSGKRGTKAQEKLKQLGFDQVQNLEGGIEAWKAAGLPVASADKKVFPLMQQVQLTIGTGVLTGAALSLTVHPYWVFLSAFFGAGLMLAGSTGWCGLAILLSKMPWNRVSGQSCGSAKNCSA
ncbi:rhodanese-related sulfurtransferase [Prosthecobacter fusiformis]|uniref:Rhodanese-related sulfurtransferase n=1 Tax=Prosthecobacter fusiformis TaxID=48464 RepID=A0A4R7SSU8_9BACT|nr:rhodanese-like domain-containing protein [Prosthecobacter fusiformis]TDU81556.1 rhodanese-related sulfurtransferase [Prosthecobacter fusiformis]